jgi:hypothetical protein
MSRSQGDSGYEARAELLAAYADGELDGDDFLALRRRVEGWLARHPEAAAELESLRRLRHLWRLAAPADPGEVAWAAVSSGIQDRLARAGAGRGPWRRWVRVLAWGAAAAILAWLALALLPGRPDDRPLAQNQNGTGTQAVPDDDPFPVATADEVEILSVQGADTGSLVVGNLPVDGELVLAAPGDVTLRSVRPAARDNMVPDVVLQGAGAPMIWARIAGEREAP